MFLVIKRDILELTKDFQRIKAERCQQIAVWIHAIRRDVGQNFSINEGTRVCSRHFRGEDLQRRLSGKVSPSTGAVTSKFAWKQSSPRKRAPPTPRFTATTVAKRKASEASEALDSSTESSKIISEDAT